MAMDEDATKHYSITIDCDDEQAAQAVQQFMQGITIDGYTTWDIGHSASGRVDVHAYLSDLKNVLAFYTEADRQYPRVSIQSYTIDKADTENWWTE